MHLAQVGCDGRFQFPDGRMYKAHSSLLLAHFPNFPFTLRSDDSTNADDSTPLRFCSRNATSSSGERPTHQLRPERLILRHDLLLVWRGPSVHFCTSDGFDSLEDLCNLAHRYGHCRLVHHYTARLIPQIATENVVDLYTWTVESQMASLREAAFNNSIGVYLVEDENMLYSSLFHLSLTYFGTSRIVT